MVSKKLYHFPLLTTTSLLLTSLVLLHVARRVLYYLIWKMVLAVLLVKKKLPNVKYIFNIVFLDILYKLIYSFLAIFVLTSCYNVPVWKYDMFKRPPGNKEYPELYIKGWQDGCESGAQASSDHVYRMRYKFKQDWQLLEKDEYRLGWEDAYNQCRKYILRYQLQQL